MTRTSRCPQCKATTVNRLFQSQMPSSSSSRALIELEHYSAPDPTETFKLSNLSHSVMSSVVELCKNGHALWIARNAPHPRSSESNNLFKHYLRAETTHRNNILYVASDSMECQTTPGKTGVMFLRSLPRSLVHNSRHNTVVRIDLFQGEKTQILPI